MPKTTHDNPEGRLGYLLTQVSFLKQRIINAELDALGVTYIQFVILAGTLELAGERAGVTQQTIATERRLDKAMVSNVVKTLVAKKLMLRKAHPSDNRAYTLSLTKTGAKIAKKGREVARTADISFFAGINGKKFGEMLVSLLENNSK